MSTCRKHVNKWLIGVAFLIQSLQIDICRKPGIERSMNASNHRSEVRDKRQPDGLPAT